MLLDQTIFLKDLFHPTQKKKKEKKGRKEKKTERERKEKKMDLDIARRVQG